MSMKAPEKLARQRLSVLQLAQTLGSVSKARRHRGMTRTQFYHYRRRFELQGMESLYRRRFKLQGMEGLKDLQPVHKTRPQTTPPEVVEQILAVSLAHPAWGSVRLSAPLKLAGISVSSPTIQDILIRAGMGRKFERLLQLEEQVAAEGLELTPEQTQAIEKANPCYRERHVESSRPGELLAADTYYVGKVNGIGKVYVHTVVDTYGSYAFGFLHTSKLPAAAVAVLHNGVLPFYAERGLQVSAVLTNNWRECCGTPPHPYELYLDLNDLEHRRTKAKHPSTNGFVERFQLTLKVEFFGVTLRETLYDAVEAPQVALDAWLTDYNTERPHLGYRNQGRRPIDTILLFTQPVSHEG